MNVIETALRSYRYLLTHKHPDELKQLACVDAALVDLATLHTHSTALASALEKARADLVLLGDYYGEGPPNVDREIAAIDAALSAFRSSTPAPDAGTDAAKIMQKWHNWICTGQTAFTAEHLAESAVVLERHGLSHFKSSTFPDSKPNPA